MSGSFHKGVVGLGHMSGVEFDERRDAFDGAASHGW
jgi:hypothetical protein